MESYEFTVIRSGFEKILQQQAVSNQLLSSIHTELVKANANIIIEPKVEEPATGNNKS